MSLPLLPRIAALVALAVLGPLLSACGGGSVASPSPPPQLLPRIDHFEASPGRVAPGGTFTLAWATSGAESVAITDVGQDLPLDGERRLRTDGDRFFTLTATNAAGSVTQNLSVATAGYDWRALEAELDALVPDTVSSYVFELRVDDATVFRRSAGLLNAQSSVFIASASKALASAAMLTLVRDGLLDLDEPVGPYLDGIIDWPADKARITTRMLLNHTSGLARDNACIEQTGTTLEACAQIIADLPLRHAPGEGFAYGGNSYQVAGLIAEVLSEQRFNAFFRTRLALPLGMTQTGFFIGDNPRVAGGATSSAPDYLRFMQMLLDDGRVDDAEFLPAELARQVRSSQIGGLTRDELPPGAGLFFDGYGLGWWHTRPDALENLSAGPEISDPGLLGTVPWIDFDRRYTAILLLDNESALVGVGTWDRLRPLILAQLAGG